MEKKLGRGLGALISEDTAKAVKEAKNDKKAGASNTVKLKDIVPNPFQPRKTFGEEKMEDLVRSIQEKGVIQPVLVRPAKNGYELIAGERRFRAAQKLKFEEIPVIIKEDIDDATTLEISIIENIQREELNPIEEAAAYKDLIEQFEYTLDKVGQMVGKNKATISNSLRLLTLSKELRNLLEEGKISTGHAKVLLSIPSEHKRKKIANAIVQKGLSVRETERIAHMVAEIRTKASKIVKDPEVLRLEEDLQHRLGTKVRIHQGKKRGRIEIQYYSNDDMNRLLSLILG